MYFRPFDPQYYEDEFEDEEMLDEEGRTRLKLKVRPALGTGVALVPVHSSQ